MSLLARWKRLFRRPHLRLIALFGVIVPRRLRANWRQEWEAELRHREALLAEWDRLDWRGKLDCCGAVRAHFGMRSGYSQRDWRTKCFKTCVLAYGCC